MNINKNSLTCQKLKFESGTEKEQDAYGEQPRSKTQEFCAECIRKQLKLVRTTP